MLGYILSNGDGAVNTTLAKLAARLTARGVSVGGVVQTNTDHGDGRSADMDLTVLPDGPVCRISQDLGPGATGCRLDPDGLETAVGLVAARLAQAQIVIVNRFGKQEAEGRGFRPLIGEALAAGIPVILALRPDFLPAFQEFTQGMGEELLLSESAIDLWAQAQLAPLRGP